MKQTRLTCLMLFLLLSPLIHPALYAWPVVNGVAVCTADMNQHLPQLVSNGRYGAIITWRDSRGGMDNIYAQSIDSTGLSIWTTNGVRVCPFGSFQNAPKIINGLNRGVIIAWEDQRSGSDIYAQSISSSGELLWAESGVPICRAADYQNEIQMLEDGLGGAFIVWQDLRAGNWDIYAQHINSQGSTYWTTNGVPVCTETTSQITPKIIRDGGDGLIICWVDHRNNKKTIYAQALYSNGSAKWTANGVAVCTTAGNQDIPSIAINGIFGAYITWEDGRNGNTDIYVQQIDSTGNLKWGGGGIAVCDCLYDQTQPKVILSGDEDPFITWQDQRDGLNNHIYAQRFSPAGTALWTINGVSVNTVNSLQVNPCMISDARGGALIAWKDSRKSDTDIYIQAIDMNGIPQLGKGGYAVVTAVNDQEYQQIAMNLNGGAMVTWIDYRNGMDYDIYVQNIDNPDRNIKNVVVTPGNCQVRLTWSTPTWSNYLATRIVRRADRYPTGPADGTTIYWFNGTSCIDTGLINGLTYYYGLYAHDTAYEYTSGKLVYTSLVWGNNEGTFNNGPQDTTYWSFQKPGGVTQMPTISWESTFLGHDGLLRINYSTATQGVKITAVHRKYNGPFAHWYHVNIKYATESTNAGHEIIAQMLSYTNHTSYTITEVGGNWTGNGQISPMTMYSLNLYNYSLESSQQIQLILKNNGSAGDFFIDSIDCYSEDPPAIQNPLSVSKTIGDFDTAADTTNWGFQNIADGINGKGTFSWVSSYSAQTGVFALNFYNIYQGVKITSSTTFNINSQRNACMSFKYRSSLSSPSTLFVLGYLYSEGDLATFKVDLAGKGVLGNSPGNQWNTVYVPLTSISGNSEFRMQLVFKNNQTPQTVYIDDIRLFDEDSIVKERWAELIDAPILIDTWM